MSHKKVLLAFVSILALFPSVVLGQSLPEEFEADVVVYGATPGGISAAAAAAREGKGLVLAGETRRRRPRGSAARTTYRQRE